MRYVFAYLIFLCILIVQRNKQRNVKMEHSVNKLKVGVTYYWFDEYVSRTDTFQVESIDLHKEGDERLDFYKFKPVGDSYLYKESLFQCEVDTYVESKVFFFSLDDIKPIKLKVKKEELVAIKRCIIKLENEIAKLEQELG